MEFFQTLFDSFQREMHQGFDRTGNGREPRAIP